MGQGARRRTRNNNINSNRMLQQAEDVTVTGDSDSREDEIWWDSVLSCNDTVAYVGRDMPVVGTQISCVGM